MGKPVAYCTIKEGLHYRAYCFHKGLERLGYRIDPVPAPRPKPEDIFVTWNRNPLNDFHAKRFEEAGCKVIVAENGYFGKDRNGAELFAMALGHHNGAGEWSVGGPERWERMNIAVAPWRRGGEEIIVMPQRGYGEPGIAMPRNWEVTALKELTFRSRRPIRVRPHPGKGRPDPAPDLTRAHAAVVWASGAGIKAIVAGVPVFYAMPKWIGAMAAKPLSDDLELPFRGDRLPMLQRLAWAQWTAEEVLAGEPFAWLLQ